MSFSHGPIKLFINPNTPAEIVLHQPEFRYFSETQLEELLNRLGHSLRQPQRIAAAVQKLSDYYISNPDAATPWSEVDVQVAYLAYYLPVGLVRWRSIVEEAKAWSFFEGLTDVVDFGSGPGTAALAVGEELSLGRMFAIERAREASQFHRRLSECWPFAQPQAREFQVGSQIPKPSDRRRTLLTLSYVLTEHVTAPPEILDYDSVLICEPSTHQDGRRLSEWREMWIENGFHIWAPCTHQARCPLLHASKKDWCHDRAHWAQPAWWSEMERHLPFKNKTVTFSYLMMSRRPPPPQPATLARLVGDRQVERGKTRQMMCRGPEREFLSWLDKAGAAPEYPRGALVTLADIQTKGSEIRAQTHLWTPPR